MAGIGKIESIGSFFVGQGDVVLFTKPNLATATLGTLAGAESLGNIHLDSTSYTGEASTLNPLKNEQGETYYSTTEGGSIGFEMFVPSTSSEIMQSLMDAKLITVTAADFTAGTSALGFGASHVTERPIAIINETLDQTLVIPNAKIVASVGMVDKVLGVSLNVLAQKVDTADLKTAMLISGDVAYEA